MSTPKCTRALPAPPAKKDLMKSPSGLKHWRAPRDPMRAGSRRDLIQSAKSTCSANIELNQWAVGSGQWAVVIYYLYATHCTLPTAHCPLATAHFYA